MIELDDAVTETIGAVVLTLTESVWLVEVEPEEAVMVYAPGVVTVIEGPATAFKGGLTHK